MKAKPARKVQKAARKRSPKKGPHATVATLNHAPGAHELAGSEERRLVLSHRALRLKIEGYTLIHIAGALVEEFQLKERPCVSSIYNWIEEAMAEGRRGAKRETENYILLAEARAEEMIQKLIPFACGNFVVERKEMIDGEQVTVIDANVLKERIMAAAEVRKQIEMVAKLRGIGRAGSEDGAKIGPDGMQTFILQTIHNHIAKSGEVLTSARAQTVLELEAGEASIDSL